MEYAGTMRTTLTTDERKKLKKISSAKGMTLVGFCDSVIRAEIKKAEKTNEKTS